jgi:Tol biopolymer transport system component
MSRLGGLLCSVALILTAVYCEAADRVAFLRIGPTDATLYIANADGTGERAVTQPGSMGSVNYNPAWSPKGDWIAFTSEKEGSADLFRVHPDGSGLERLTDDPAFDDQAAFYPDEKQIVFVSTRAAGFADLWILDLATHKARPLTSGRGGDFRPAWSPDGKWIAFSSDRESDAPPAKGRWERLHLLDIFVMRPDGTGLKRVTEHGGACGTPKWMPDSKSVVAYCMSAQESWSNRSGSGEGDDRLVKIDISSGAATPIAAGPGVKLAPSILPSGGIAYLRRDKDERGVFYADGSKGPSGDDLRVPSWSPDGKQVVYSRFVTKRGPAPAKLWSRNPHFELYSTRWLPAYDLSGENLATTKPNADNSVSLVVIDQQGNEHTVLKDKRLILAPQWSPDGKQLVFGIGAFAAFLDFAIGEKKPFDPVNGGAQVGIINADGSGFEVVTSGPNNNAFPSFSPDGKHIAYRTLGASEQGLRIMNLDDRSTVQITTEWDNFPIWSPAGNRIAFIRKTGEDFQVFTIRSDGKDLKQLTDTHGIDAHLAWSPDGERLLFTSSRKGFKDEALYTGGPQPYGEIFVMNSDGTHIEQLTDDQWEEGGPAWGPQPSSFQKVSLLH